ncbi:unnamed protein product [Caenorhabditis brenneri]
MNVSYFPGYKRGVSSKVRANAVVANTSGGAHATGELNDFDSVQQQIFQQEDEVEQRRGPAPREKDPEEREKEVERREEEVGVREEEPERTGEELEARGMELKAGEEGPAAEEEEEDGTEAQEYCALQSSSHDPLEEISLEEIEQQTLYTQDSVQFSEQLQKEHREYEMQLQSTARTENTGFYFNLEAEFRWQQDHFPSFQWNGENNWYGEGSGTEQQTGEFNGSHFLNQHNHY